MNESILLIGAGNLGSRHLQSLAAAPWIGRVTVVEPNTAAADVARTRWLDVPGHEGKTLDFRSLDELAQHGPFDAAVIATPSLGRLQILRAVLALGVKRILCEKVLFQSVAELDAAELEAGKAGADVRVNHIYRYAEALRALHEISSAKKIDMSVAIDGDGMACNLIHYIDLFAYLGGGEIAALNVAIDKPVHPSKRGGSYVEFTGHATAQDQLGSTLRVTYRQADTAKPPIIQVSGGFGQLSLDESTGEIAGSIPALTSRRFDAPRVSALTAVILEDQREGRCLLPTLSESARMNRPLLEAFNTALTGKHDLQQACPIT